LGRNGFRRALRGAADAGEVEDRGDDGEDPGGDHQDHRVCGRPDEHGPAEEGGRDEAAALHPQDGEPEREERDAEAADAEPVAGHGGAHVDDALVGRPEPAAEPGRGVLGGDEGEAEHGVPDAEEDEDPTGPFDHDDP
jgi:hypothetical protein